MKSVIPKKMSIFAVLCKNKLPHKDMVYRRYYNTGGNRMTPEERHRAKELGKWGEETAVQYLKDNGYAILERNYRKGHLEIDIIAYYEGLLVVVEVKTRSSDTFMRPEEAVNHKKRVDLMRLATYYIKSHRMTEEVRFDVISIVANAQGTEIQHIKDAFNNFYY